MDERAIYEIVWWAFLGLAGVAFLYLLFRPAPYGRHGQAPFGPRLSARAGWIVMEGPAAIGMASLAISGTRLGTGALVGLLLWETHYVYRAFIYPFRLRGPGKTMPLVVALSGATFQITNTYLNGRWLFALGPDPSEAPGGLLRIGVGALLFAIGFAIHQHADHVLLTLRGPGETGYKIPRGGLYRFVSCPNYLGEILAWTGFAVVCASRASLLFAVWSTANLLPRALSNHRWYREKFADYPSERRALVPFFL